MHHSSFLLLLSLALFIPSLINIGLACSPGGYRVCDHVLKMNCGNHGFGCAYADLDSTSGLLREFRNIPTGTGCAIEISTPPQETNVALMITTKSETSAIGISPNAGVSFDAGSGAVPGLGIEGTLEKSVSVSTPITVRGRFAAWCSGGNYDVIANGFDHGKLVASTYTYVRAYASSAYYRQFCLSEYCIEGSHYGIATWKKCEFWYARPGDGYEYNPDHC